jgi:hypothetical protein
VCGPRDSGWPWPIGGPSRRKDFLVFFIPFPKNTEVEINSGK